jgi:hypothetical protein
LRNQTRPSVNRVLEGFFRTEAETIVLETSLVVIDGARVRVVRPGRLVALSVLKPTELASYNHPFLTHSPLPCQSTGL